MRPTARQLALRDPAAAALMGLVGGRDADFGSDFGWGDADMGDDYGDPYGAEFGDEDDIWGEDVDFGADFGAAKKKPPAQAMAKAYMAAKAKKAKTAKRAQLLEPNRGSAAKIERYSFTLSTALVLGTASSISNLTGSPDVDVRAQRFVTNAPVPGFITLSLVKFANVTINVGPGVEDAFDYSAIAVGTALDLPTLTPANRVTIAGAYTGFIPPGYVDDAAFTATFSFKGWASIVA